MDFRTNKRNRIENVKVFVQNKQVKQIDIKGIIDSVVYGYLCKQNNTFFFNF